eukprot:85329-Prorocentrum_minimum.AAC.1
MQLRWYDKLMILRYFCAWRRRAGLIYILCVLLYAAAMVRQADDPAILLHVEAARGPDIYLVCALVCSCGGTTS